jgi:bacteriocin-like protein
MHKKNLTPQPIQPTNRITIPDLFTEFAELSDKDLQQIVGGRQPSIGGGQQSCPSGNKPTNSTGNRKGD